MNKTAVLLVTCAAFIVVMAGIVVLTIAGKDTSVFIGFATSAAVFLVPQLLNLLKSHDTQNDVAEIKERTNGPLTTMQNQVNLLVQEFEKHIKNGDSNAGSS